MNHDVFARKVATGWRTYFLDVKETREGSLYPVIGELTQVGSDTERHRVMVFEEALDDFVPALREALDYIYRERGGTRALTGTVASDGGGSGFADQQNRMVEILSRIELTIGDIYGVLAEQDSANEEQKAPFWARFAEKEDRPSRGWCLGVALAPSLIAPQRYAGGPT